MIAPTGEDSTSPPHGVPDGYFDAVYGAFRAAERAVGSVVRTYGIAGLTIEFRFAGSALLELIDGALGHLRVPPGDPPDRTVVLWDGASTGIHALGSRRVLQTTGAHRLLPAEGRIRVASHHEFSSVWLYDPERALALSYYPSPTGLPVHERAAPVRIILHWCIESPTVQLVHAGAIGAGGSGVLLAGRGGAGKSTTALTCLDAGMQYVGDDYIAIDAGERPTAWSLYRTAKLNPDSLERLPVLASLVQNHKRPESDKALVSLGGAYDELTVSHVPVRAIVLPMVTDRAETSLERVPGAAAAVALAPGSIFYLPDAGAQAFRAIASFVKRVPSYALRIGRASDNIPELLTSLSANG